MKKQMLFAAGLLLMSASITFAQDSTKTDASQKSTTQSQTNPSSASQSQSYTKDMTKIQSSEIPAGLKQTLGGSQYKGWEQGTIYRSKNSDAYVIEMTTNGKTQSHRFGADGKPSKDN